MPFRDFGNALSAINPLLRGYSIELNPGDAKTLHAAAERLDPGTEVSLAWIPGSNPMDMIAPAASLRRAGHIPMPHVGARHLESAEQLQAAPRFKMIPLQGEVLQGQLEN